MIRLRDLVPFFFVVRTFLIKIGIIVCGLVSILWISGGIYGSFYYACLPHQTYSMPVYFTFQPCPLESEQPRCSWISAKIDFQDEKLVLEPNEKYTLRLELNLPSDEINRNTGMFIVCLNLKPLEAEVIQKCKSSILPHRTSISRLLRSLFPFQNYGGEESLSIEFYSQMQRSENSAPITEAEIVVQSKSLGISDASFHIHAHFTGISHFMYHYPISSGIAGITIISIVLVSLLFLLIGASVDPVQVSAFQYQNCNTATEDSPRSTLNKCPNFGRLVNRVNKEKHEPDQRQTNLHQD